MNPNCRQLLVMKYLKMKCGYSPQALIDLLSENGRMVHLGTVYPQKNVKNNFEERVTYIPVLLERADDDTFRGNYKTMKPQLVDWEKKFPEIEKKITMLTGDAKRRKSITTPKAPGARYMSERRGSTVGYRVSSRTDLRKQPGPPGSAKTPPRGEDKGGKAKTPKSSAKKK